MMKKSLLIKKMLICALLLAFVLAVIYLWHGNCLVRKASYNSNIIMELGRLAGLLGVCCILLQLLLIGRVSWVERLFGLDRLSLLHHVNGLFIIPLLAAHPILLSWGYGMRDGNSLLAQYRELFTWGSVPQASAGLVILMVIVLLSTGIIRRRLKYERWLSVHVLAYAAIALAFAHQFSAGNDLLDSPQLLALWYGLYVFSFGNLLLYRCIKPLFLFARHGFRVDRIERESSDVVSIYITGRKMEQFRFQAGQFIMVRFLAKGFMSESHPFSLSGAMTGNQIRISVKNSGDYTTRIPSLPAGAKVIIDGPHGIFTTSLAEKNQLLLIAGGIGITPLRAIAEASVRKGNTVTLLYSCRKKPGIVFQDELDRLAREAELDLHYIVSDEPGPGEEKGRINGEKIARLVPDAAERDVFLCGPPAMMAELVRILKSLGVPGNHIHYERFSL